MTDREIVTAAVDLLQSVRARVWLPRDLEVRVQAFFDWIGSRRISGNRRGPASAERAGRRGSRDDGGAGAGIDDRDIGEDCRRIR